MFKKLRPKLTCNSLNKEYSKGSNYSTETNLKEASILFYLSTLFHQTFFKTGNRVTVNTNMTSFQYRGERDSCSRDCSSRQKLARRLYSTAGADSSVSLGLSFKNPLARECISLTERRSVVKLSHDGQKWWKDRVNEGNSDMTEWTRGISPHSMKEDCSLTPLRKRTRGKYDTD